jgi:hypothetical protein
MAVRCRRCGGIVPDFMSADKDRNDCKNHIVKKPDIREEDVRK